MATYLKVNSEQLNLPTTKQEPTQFKLSVFEFKSKDFYKEQIEPHRAENDAKIAQIRASETARASVPSQAPVSLQSLATAPPTGSHTDWMAQAGIDPSNYGYVEYIVSRESGWRVNATNASSGAYGLPQALPGGKMASAGSDWATNPITQLRWMNGYVGRYGGWAGAYNFWLSHHWY